MKTISMKTFSLSLSLEYIISKALSNSIKLDFKDTGQSSFIGDT